MYVRIFCHLLMLTKARLNVEALTTKFLEALNNLGLPLDEMRAQGYDGASVMSGHVNGMQARIKQQNIGKLCIFTVEPMC